VVVERIVVVGVAEACAVLGPVEDSSFAENLRAEAHIVVVLRMLGLDGLWAACMYYLE
jgi:hypothetical protein